ncbi:hypothetical protein K470DRAFT_74713 [Piedraia hortae CBS 480.64]|uniref:non-specific serine/threonine protein kinase n=1 Tax=Piedraia hortae CBS 480.64 TaxID=1314780 RepID=A0A6A7BZ27_9PEZI|nr:hypothetical protein K470DRAFT_74713 [Piedraia hortae CBS 480.64]
MSGIRFDGKVNGPPPSTLAAQIVQNQTKPVASQQVLSETPSFAHLLHEILNDPGATQETDQRTNVSLVAVVTEAGLAPLAREDPFVQRDSLIPQADDSIAVIELTISRQPEILLMPLSENGPPLAVSLLAQIAAICGRPKCETLHLPRLINAAVRALTASVYTWHLAGAFRQVCQHVVDDALSVLEADVKTHMTSGFSLKLPSAQSISALWPQSKDMIAIPVECQTTITNRGHALHLALLLSSIPTLNPTWRKETARRLSDLAPRLQSILERTNQWATTVRLFLGRDDCPRMLGRLLRDVVKTDLPLVQQQDQLANALIRMLKVPDSLTKEIILPQVQALVESSKFERLQDDLKSATAAWLHRYVPPADLPTQVEASLNGNTQCNLAQNEDATELHEDCDISINPRKRKRRKLNDDISDLRLSEKRHRLTKLLTGNAHNDISSIAASARTSYAQLPPDNQWHVWSLLASLSTTDRSPVHQTISQLLSLPEVRKSKRARVLAMFAIQGWVSAATSEAELDLSKSDFGDHCLKSLQSSLRELRIAAGQCLPMFLGENVPAELRIKNRQTALIYLRKLSNETPASMQETLIGTWGHVARVCGQSELNLVLLRLVDYLGHPNVVACAAAFDEVEKIANARKSSIMDLFRPFWSTVAVAAVRDLKSCPQKIQNLCDLLRVEVNAFLVMTQYYTVPDLVLNKKRDILQRIAEARGKKESVRDVCLQPISNLAATLACLFFQPVGEVEKAALQCLVHVAPEFAGVDLASIVKIDSVLTSCEMLKRSGDAPVNEKQMAIRAFQSFTHMAQKSSGEGSDVVIRQGRSIVSFFDTHILGIMTHFSKALDDNQDGATMAEKMRWLNGLKDMIGLIKHHACVALPQIKAFLQSAMDKPELCETAFETWLTLLSVLNADDLISIIEQTFALVVQHWSRLSPKVQTASYTQLTDLVKANNHVFRENVLSLPSLKDIPIMSKLENQFERLRDLSTVETRFRGFETRLQNESEMVVCQALRELIPFLVDNQEFIHDAAVSEQPEPVLGTLVRTLLDVSTKLASRNKDIAGLSGEALGVIGCLDPNRVEVSKKPKQLLMLSNFEKANEVIDWVVVMFDEVLVKAFKSSTDTSAQGILAYVIQELLHFCGFNDDTTNLARPSQAAPDAQKRWASMPEHIRITLMPFLTSRYLLTRSMQNPTARSYPGFDQSAGHAVWLRSLVSDLMFKGKGHNAKMVFPLLARSIRRHDLAIAKFILPYAVLNVVIGGTVSECDDIQKEFLAVLRCQPSNKTELETVKQCSETVFAVLDYLSRWLQEKKKVLAQAQSDAYRNSRSQVDFEEEKNMEQIKTISRFLRGIPAETLATRSMECGSHARALFNWEQYIRQQRALIPPPRMSADAEKDYARLHQIYAAIDEPDGLEGIGAHLPLLTEEQQAVQHTKAGRWTAAQEWFELQLSAQPSSGDLQASLLNCLREMGQHASLLRSAKSFLMDIETGPETAQTRQRLLSYAVEAAWMSGDLSSLKNCLKLNEASDSSGFESSLGRIIVGQQGDNSISQLSKLQASVAQGLTESRTSSLHACHGELLKLQMLYELDAIKSQDQSQVERFRKIADKRLESLGSCNADKLQVLGLRRAAMLARRETFADTELASSWLATARLARKAGNTHSAYHAVLQAYACGDQAAKLEEARLLWHDGHQRQAIQALESAIESGVFDVHTNEMEIDTAASTDRYAKQNLLSARAQLLYAKWLDATGQSQTKDMTARYQNAARNFRKWEKGHYYLGRHYNKVLEAEKMLPKAKQSPHFHSGEMTKSTIDNLLRSIPFGNKYWHLTIPKALTLWLDLGMNTITRAPKEEPTVFQARVKSLQTINRQIQKYSTRVPSYVFYPALSQLLSRISHPNTTVWSHLASLITRILTEHPNEALWSLFPLLRATDPTRSARAKEIIARLRDPGNKPRHGSLSDLKALINHGQKLSEGLLHACEAHVEQRKVHVSLGNDLHFNHKLAPCSLVVPVEAMLTPNIPSSQDNHQIVSNKAFPQTKVMIQAFKDEVLVLSSLQRPRKITVLGTDGRKYGLLCKPRDDLRKDRRLMEFNGIINRALKRDVESSKRRLYIKTYAVTPLSEESGTIEWVEGIKPTRDLLLNIYARKGIKPNYTEIRKLLDQAAEGPANVHLFKEKVLSNFPAVLHEWFAETYPEPETWFNARLRYARSAAVMSITGHVLGLGDRHGENILIEESTGGIFHVDFNCLFDKGLTFEKPELVPFRLTHNMVDAMGPYGYEGPFRKSCELTYNLLRQNRDTLMTVLETFLHDPTTDFAGRRKRPVAGVPETPQEILDSVQGKLKGLYKDEKVPLGVEGYVDVLIREAVNPANLAAMYIGWCAFL